MPPSNGKTLPPINDVTFLLDESMDRYVADALKLVGYDFTSVALVWPGQSKVEDSEIIEWCKNNNAVWVHADDRARRKHATLILTSQIRTVWVYRRDGKMSGADQLRILSYFLQEILNRFRTTPNKRHWKIKSLGNPPHPGLGIEEYALKQSQ